MKRVSFLLSLLLLSLLAVPFALAGPRLNQLQSIGTHNSYKLELHPTLDHLIRTQSPAQADALNYSHRSLTEQLERLAVRHVELDVYPDSLGGRFSNPVARQFAPNHNLPPPPAPPAHIMDAPGMKVLHVPDFDYQSTVLTLAAALTELLLWSETHPEHIPILILVELKSDVIHPEFTRQEPWTADLLNELEREILAILPRNKIIAPDDVRGDYPDLRSAILESGWPSLASCRGRFLLAMDNTGTERDLYLEGNPTLAGRLLFTSVQPDHPAAAWFKINDPVAHFSQITNLVSQGFLVRTRADADTKEARTGSSERRDQAFASGAQFISTDYPEPRRAWSDYNVRFPDGQVARRNPVSARELDPSIDMEELAPTGLAPFDMTELEHLQRRATRHHLKRCLDAASTDYQRLLDLDPPTQPTQLHLDLANALRPILRTHPDEPFRLEHLIMIHHPVEPWVGCHLFWTDDIDFPDDNDPIDHEVVWIKYDPESKRPIRTYAYFHGQIISTDVQSDERPAFAVEWGKHGSLPFSSANNRLPVEVERLQSNWRQLNTRGIRRPNSPLAKGWPVRFEKPFEAYQTFSMPGTGTGTGTHGDDAKLQVFVSRWANAVMNRWALPFNFSAKPEWPQELTQ